jgi:hypothetical protein
MCYKNSKKQLKMAVAGVLIALNATLNIALLKYSTQQIVFTTALKRAFVTSSAMDAF